MIYLFFGPDKFSQKAEINLIAQKAGSHVERLEAADFEAVFQKLLETDLFSQSFVFVLQNAIAKLDLDKQLQKLAAGPNTIVFVEDKLDKRTKQTQSLLKNKAIKAVEFVAPSGPALVSWIQTQTQQLGANIEPEAIELLVTYLATKDQNERDLNQLYNELAKLAAYAAGRPITANDVKELVTRTYDTEIWDIINAVAEKKTREIFQSLENFFKQADSTDEKTKVIQLAALLSDQFRNILLAKSFLEQNVSESEILKQTSWKPGRLFIMKRLAKNFETAKILQVLSKLEHLDLELKTSSTPPRVTLELIAAQMV